jgi:hypothetical protein
MDTSSTTPPEKFVDTSGGTNVDFPDRTFAVWGDSASGDAVRGTAESGTGVHGSSSSGSGVLGATTSLYGVEGSADGTGAGVYGHTDGPGSGTIGHSEGGYGVQGSSGSSYGIYGTTSVGSAGMYGFAVDGYGVLGESISNAGVLGSSREWYGVEGVTNGREREHTSAGECCWASRVTGRTVLGYRTCRGCDTSQHHCAYASK